MTAGLDLLAEGGKITLTDGTEVPLRYSFRALALLEARFGGIDKLQQVIDSTGKGAAFGPIAQVIGAGTVGPGGYEPHIREYQDTKGERRVQDIVYRRRSDGVMLDDLLDPGRLDEYTSAFTGALSKALQNRSRGNDQAPPAETVTPGLEPASPGTNTSTSQSVPSTFQSVSSGT
jgi:hypothetical protein